MKTFLKHFLGSERGASMVEYGLMVALVSIIAVPAVSMAGHKTEATFNTVAESLAATEGVPAPGDEDDTPAPGDDDDTPAPGDDDDTPAPGDDDDTPAPGDDDDTPAPGDDDDTPAPGDDDDTPAPGDDDDTPAPGDDDDAPAPGSEAVVSSTDASFTGGTTPSTVVREPGGLTSSSRTTGPVTST